MLMPEEYLKKVTETITALDREKVDAVVAEFERVYREGRRLFACGNGGSASTASHLVCDFQKSLIAPNGHCLKAFALTDSQPLITAWANDADYAQVFANQLGVLAEEGDVLLAISGSGNSPNVLNAVERAKEMGVFTIGWSAFDGGQLARMVDLSVVVPVHNMQVAEDLHLILGHLVFTQLMQQMPQSAAA
ncbi:MAG: SIS domain-containing protein [Armatimonadetes bacterium]|nr:SIS domain-containing protein [Armatimonadota bacterium]